MDAARDAELRRELSNEAQRIAIDAEYTGRQHFEVGRRWRVRATWLGLPVTVVAAATSVGAGLTALVDAWTWVPLVLGFAGAVLIALQKFLRPDEQATEHAVKAAKCMAIRSEARRFRNLDMRSSLSTDALKDRIDALGRRYDDLRQAEPLHLPDGVYAKVKADIEAGNYTYENDPLWDKAEA